MLRIVRIDTQLNGTAVHTISATDLARNTREILDRVATRGETVAVERNHALIVKIVPAEPTMTAAQALIGLPLANLTPAQASSWLKDSQAGFDETVLNPWG
jgi:antitoxin (DNA-binding transcriptional repressor) of toxin-antitoxin stability system